MPVEVERLSRQYFRRAVHITIGTAGQAVERIQQTVVWTVSENQKKYALFPSSLILPRLT